MDPLLTQAQLDIQERIAQLPEDVASVITDGTLDATVFLIQDKYPLTQEQITALENEIILVLALYFSPKEFVDNIQEALNIQRPTAEAIGADVSSDIFELFEDFFELVEKSQEEIERGTNIDAVPAALAKKEDLKNLAQAFSQTKTQETIVTEPPTPVTVTQAPISTPSEALTGNVEPLRTMEGDMNRIHGYGAYAATHPEILKDDASESEK